MTFKIICSFTIKYNQYLRQAYSIFILSYHYCHVKTHSLEFKWFTSTYCEKVTQVSLIKLSYKSINKVNESDRGEPIIRNREL